MILNDKYVKRYLWLLIVLFVIFTLIWKITPRINTPERAYHHFQKNFLSLEKELKETSKQILFAVEVDSLLSWEDLSSLIKGPDVTGFLFKNDSLIYWNDNKINPDFTKMILPNTIGFYQNKKDWFVVFKSKNIKWNIILVVPVIKHYFLRNEFFSDEYNTRLIKDNNILLTNINESDDYLIKDSEGSPVVSLIMNNFNVYNKTVITFLFIVLLIIYLLIESLLLRITLLTF